MYSKRSPPTVPAGMELPYMSIPAKCGIAPSTGISRFRSPRLAANPAWWKAAEGFRLWKMGGNSISHSLYALMLYPGQNPIRNGRHVGTRTPDLYRVNFEVNSVKSFLYLAFPHFVT